MFNNQPTRFYQGSLPVPAQFLPNPNALCAYGSGQLNGRNYNHHFNNYYTAPPPSLFNFYQQNPPPNFLMQQMPPQPQQQYQQFHHPPPPVPLPYQTHAPHQLYSHIVKQNPTNIYNRPVPLRTYNYAPPPPPQQPINSNNMKLSSTINALFRNEYSLFLAADDLNNPPNPNVKIVRDILTTLPSTQLKPLPDFQQTILKTVLKLIVKHTYHSYQQYMEKKKATLHNIQQQLQQYKINGKTFQNIIINSFQAAMEQSNRRRKFKLISKQLNNFKTFFTNELFQLFHGQLNINEVLKTHPTNAVPTNNAAPAHADHLVSENSINITPHTASTHEQIINNNSSIYEEADDDTNTNHIANFPLVTHTSFMNQGRDIDETNDNTDAIMHTSASKTSTPKKDNNISRNYHLQNLREEFHSKATSKAASVATSNNSPTVISPTTPITHDLPTTSTNNLNFLPQQPTTSTACASTRPHKITQPSQLQKAIHSFAFNKLDNTTHHTPRKDFYSTEPPTLGISKNVKKDQIIKHTELHLPADHHSESLTTLTIVNNIRSKSTTPLNSSFTYLPPTVTPPATHINFIFSLKACVSSPNKLEWPILTKDGFIEVLFTDEATIDNFPWIKFYEIIQKNSSNTFIFSTYNHLQQFLKTKIFSLTKKNLFNVSSFLR